MKVVVNKGLSEKDIIKGCINGDKKSQEALYGRFSSKMMGVCLRYAKDYHNAEDLLQEGFIKVFVNMHKYRGDGSFEGWLRRIFVNTAIEHYRKNVHLYPLSELNNFEVKSEEVSADSKIAADDLLGMLQQLSAGYRTIFNLYAIEGYSHKEIASELNISEGTSKSQLARARALLQKMVNSYEKKGKEAYV